MSVRIKHCINVFACVLVFILLAAAQPAPVSASDSNLMLAYEEVNLDQASSPAVKDESAAAATAASTAATAKNTGAAISYNSLGFSTIDLSVLAKYIDVKEITEKEFYELNFGMKIASVALTTTDNDLLLRTTDNTYCTIKISDEYLRAMEMTGVVEKGVSQKIEVQEQKKTGAFTSFILVSLIVSLIMLIGWFFIINRKAYEPDRIGVNAKDKGKNAPPVPEKKITFNEVQGIDELKPDLFRLVDSLKFPAKYKRLGGPAHKRLDSLRPSRHRQNADCKSDFRRSGSPVFFCVRQ